MELYHQVIIPIFEFVSWLSVIYDLITSKLCTPSNYELHCNFIPSYLRVWGGFFLRVCDIIPRRPQVEFNIRYFVRSSLVRFLWIVQVVCFFYCLLLCLCIGQVVRYIDYRSGVGTEGNYCNQKYNKHGKREDYKSTQVFSFRNSTYIILKPDKMNKKITIQYNYSGSKVT